MAKKAVKAITINDITENQTTMSFLINKVKDIFDADPNIYNNGGFYKFIDFDNDYMNIEKIINDYLNDNKSKLYNETYSSLRTVSKPKRGELYRLDEYENDFEKIFFNYIFYIYAFKDVIYTRTSGMSNLYIYGDEKIDGAISTFYNNLLSCNGIYTLDMELSKNNSFDDLTNAERKIAKHMYKYLFDNIKLFDRFMIKKMLLLFASEATAMATRYVNYSPQSVLSSINWRYYRKLNALTIPDTCIDSLKNIMQLNFNRLNKDFCCYIYKLKKSYYDFYFEYYIIMPLKIKTTFENYAVYYKATGRYNNLKKLVKKVDTKAKNNIKNLTNKQLISLINERINRLLKTSVFKSYKYVNRVPLTSSTVALNNHYSYICKSTLKDERNLKILLMFAYQITKEVNKSVDINEKYHIKKSLISQLLTITL